MSRGCSGRSAPGRTLPPSRAEATGRTPTAQGEKMERSAADGLLGERCAYRQCEVEARVRCQAMRHPGSTMTIRSSTRASARRWVGRVLSASIAASRGTPMRITCVLSGISFVQRGIPCVRAAVCVSRTCKMNPGSMRPQVSDHDHPNVAPAIAGASISKSVAARRHPIGGGADFHNGRIRLSLEDVTVSIVTNCIGPGIGLPVVGVAVLDRVPARRRVVCGVGVTRHRLVHSRTTD